MDENRIVAGAVNKVKTNQQGYHYATVEPIAEADASSSTWEDLSTNVMEEFPGRGLLFWHNPPPTVAENTLWEFRLDDVEGWGVDEKKRDKYQITDPRGLVEVLDLRSYDDAERELRESFTSTGLFLPKKPLTNKLYLLISDKEMLGPVLLKEIGDDRWCIDGGNDSEKLVDLQVMRPPLDRLKEVQFKGKKRLFIPPGGYDGAAIGHKNWEPYSILLRRVFKRLVKYDQKKAHDLGIGTKKIIDEFIEAVERMGLIDSELQKELTRKERLGELLKLIEDNREMLDEALRILTTSSTIQAELERFRVSERDRIRIEEEKIVKIALDEKRQELEKVKENIEQKKRQLADMSAQINEEEKKLQEKMSSFEQELVRRFKALVDKPESAFPDLALFKKVFTNAVGERCTDEAVLEFGPLFPSEVSAQVLSDITHIGGSIDARILAEGLASSVSRSLLASFLTGLVPTIDGTGAYQALSAIADTLAGGRLIWIPIPASYYEPQDIFGQLAHDGRFQQNPCGLLSLIRHAVNNPNELCVVVFDGFNKSSADSYLMPLLKSIKASAQGKRLSIPLSTRQILDGNASKAVVARVSWPRNILLALVPAPKEVAIPISSELLDCLVPLVCSVPDDDSYKPMTTQRIPITQVSASAWFDKINVEIAGAEHGTDPNKVANIVKESGIDVSQVFRRLFRAGRRAGMDVESAVNYGISIGVITQLATNKKKVEAIFEKAGLTVDKSILQIQSLVTKLGG